MATDLRFNKDPKAYLLECYPTFFQDQKCQVFDNLVSDTIQTNWDH